MEHLMYLNIGDWSDDGHGKYRRELYKCNHPVTVVQQAYKTSCKTTGVQFNHNKDYTGGLCKGYRSWRQICTKYEVNTLEQDAVDLLIEYIPSIHEYLEDDNMVIDFEGLWWEFVKISLPDLKYEKVGIQNINGYWNEELNVQFGYGLFY